MPGGVNHRPGGAGRGDDVAVGQIRRGKVVLEHLEAFGQAGEDGAAIGQNLLVGRVHIDGDVVEGQQFFHAPRMVKMAVGKQDGIGPEAFTLHIVRELLHSFVGGHAGIHHGAGVLSVGPQDHAIGSQGVESKYSGMKHFIAFFLQIYDNFTNFVEPRPRQHAHRNRRKYRQRKNHAHHPSGPPLRLDAQIRVRHLQPLPGRLLCRYQALVLRPGNVLPAAAPARRAGDFQIQGRDHPGPHPFRGRSHLRGQQLCPGEPVGKGLQHLHGHLQRDDGGGEGAGPDDIPALQHRASGGADPKTRQGLRTVHLYRIPGRPQPALRAVDSLLQGKAHHRGCRPAGFPQPAGRLRPHHRPHRCRVVRIVLIAYLCESNH